MVILAPWELNNYLTSRETFTMAIRTIAGTVNEDGSAKYGSDFISSRTSEGHYMIEFRPAFGELGGVSVTQIFNEGNTRDNAVIIRLNASHAFIKTGNDSGSARDRSFSFVAAGTGSVALDD